MGLLKWLRGLSQKQKAGFVILIFVVAGTVGLLLTGASAVTVRFEAEGGRIANNATIKTDGSRSGGQYVQFGSNPTVNPQKIAIVGDIAWVSKNYQNKTKNGSDAVADLIATTVRPSALFTLGDTAYSFNQDFQFNRNIPFPASGPCRSYTSNYYAKWDQFYSIVHPVIGDHEYYYNTNYQNCPRTSGKTADDTAKPFWDYFGGRINTIGNVIYPGSNPAGVHGDFSSRKGYYSVDISGWHFIVLNSICAHPAAGSAGANGSDVTKQMVPGGCAIGSPQYNWLQNDLQQHSRMCTAALWHYPQFQAGISYDPIPSAASANVADDDVRAEAAEYVPDTATGVSVPAAGTVQQNMSPLVNLLYQYHADVLFTGHSHFYEHMASLNPATRQADPRGLESFVVGTGGADMGALKGPFSPLLIAHSGQSRQDFGVLELTLNPTNASYRFVGVDNAATTTVNDAGTIACHN